MRFFLTCLLVVTFCWLPIAELASGQELAIPRRQDKPPGPPLTPQQSVDKMTVPDGFSIELVAAEPQIVNPVAMCIDAKGRFWVTESFEYPRRSAGPGRDRIKVLEDTNGDGQVDKVTVFAEGLNIPSGIAVGHGGVWVANAPDLLFLKDTTGDMKADVIERVVTGFGRTDTHELPNAFTWGPDGWLYGLNGVFNYCDVRYTEENPQYDPNHPGWKFTCALWRVHPVTREFQIFAEGTSNPWGIAINSVGDFFLSACVIDHLWHITETGYYIRQGGPYPAHTWPMGSIVEHKHQKAAYCGIVYFDSDAYPDEYRDVLYMGNVHAGCLNADVLERQGASYFGKPRPDLITANDVWSMPVAQKVGPDGSLYVLDWYDRYHCYQDANADPEGVDRSKGRLYRLRYQGTPRAVDVDLESESDDRLIARLEGPNAHLRQVAQRLLVERGNASSTEPLDQMTHDDSLPIKHRLHAFWASEGIKEGTARGAVEGSGGQGAPRDFASLRRCLDDSNADLRRWAVRIWGDADDADWKQAEINELIGREDDPRVLVQWAIAVQKHPYPAERQAEWIAAMLRREGDDKTFGHIAWNAFRQLSDDAPDHVVDAVLSVINSPESPRSSGDIAVRLLDKLCGAPDERLAAICALSGGLLDASASSADWQRQTIEILASRTRQHAFDANSLEQLSSSLQKRLVELRSGDDGRLASNASVLLALWGDGAAQHSLAGMVRNDDRDDAVRTEALQTLVFADSDQLVPLVSDLLEQGAVDESFLENILNALGASSDVRIADVFLARFDQFDSALQPKIIELLTQRAHWSLALLKAVDEGKVNRYKVNLNQLRRLASFDDSDVQTKVASIYGTVRNGRGSDRAKSVADAKERLAKSSGDPFAGEKVFKTVCAQCHKMYGEGVEVGPDITRNGRNDWNQLLHNVFDPSAVIGPGYEARTILTVDGRVLTGLPVEETDQRIILKLQGGKTEAVPRSEVELYKTNAVSMMPDELEKQLTAKELADLFAFLALDKHPSDPSAKLLSGAPEQDQKDAE